MRIPRIAATVAAGLLVPAAAAVAASGPFTGVYSGNTTSKDAGGHADSFKVEGTFNKGRLTRLYGVGNWIPFNAKLSNSMMCGGAQIYDSADQADHGKYAAKISGQVNRAGHFTFTLKDKLHTTVTLEGKFTSASSARAKVRFYIAHMPTKAGMTGHCDSGVLPVTLTRS